MADQKQNPSLINDSDIEEELSTQAHAFWLYGEWEKLSQLDVKGISRQEDRAQIASLVASAHLQLEQVDSAHRWLKLAERWGVDSNTLSKILIAGLNNTLGRIASLQGNDDKATEHFERAVNVTKNSELVAHSRAIRELANLGLLPQASQLVTKQLDQVKNQPSTIKDMSAHLKVLETSLELLNHELSISQQRLQLYDAGQPGLAHQEAGTEGYIEQLKHRSVSQLGQDLWVLEKTGFKRNGFFVEFGATDGVLLSNTYLLEKEFGWTGICAEPNPKFYEKLKKNRNCKVSNACIAGETGHEVEFIFADEYGGLKKYADSDNHSEKRLAYRRTVGLETLTTTSLDDFLCQNEAPRNIDYISIDTEGSELEILQSFPFEKWHVKIFSVEHNYTDSRDRISKIFADKGYERVEFGWDDIFYLKV